MSGVTAGSAGTGRVRGGRGCLAAAAVPLRRGRPGLRRCAAGEGGRGRCAGRSRSRCGPGTGPEAKACFPGPECRFYWRASGPPWGRNRSGSRACRLRRVAEVGRVRVLSSVSGQVAGTRMAYRGSWQEPSSARPTRRAVLPDDPSPGGPLLEPWLANRLASAGDFGSGAGRDRGSRTGR